MNSDNAHTSDPMWSEPLPASYSSLTETEASFFLHHGWLRVPNAINPEYIDKWMADFWDRTGYDPNDKSTWKQEYLFMPHHRQVRIEEFCPEAWKKIVDIAGGEDRIDPDRERWIGDNFIVNFGSEARSKGHKCTDPATRAGWHADNDWYRQFLDSAGTAMTVVHCFTDIPPDGGGTWLCEDGIEGVVKTLYDHPEGLDPAVNCDIMFTHMPKCKRFTPLVANKGDTFILHGLLPHVAGYNHLHYARVITNPHITLKTEYNLNRPAKDYSLLEQVILRGLGRSSVPEFKPTRERKYWYPRNSDFKLVKSQEEIERIKAARNTRGDTREVESIWLDGPKAEADFKRRNGLLLPLNKETGMEMHDHIIV